MIEKGIKELHSYLQDKTAEIRDVERYLQETAHLNRRQMALLGHAMRHPDHVYTIESHRRCNEVVYQTARTDLLELVAEGYLKQVRLGRAMGFVATLDRAQQS